MAIDILKKKNAALLLIYLLDGPKKMTELKSVVSSYQGLEILIRDLESMGYVVRNEEIKDRRVIYVSLTKEGREVAEQLKKLEKPVPSGFFTEEQELLMYLAEKGEEDFDSLKEKFSGAYSAVKKFSELGLVVQEARVEGLNTINRIRITEKGRKIANHAKEIEKILKEEKSDR